MTLLIVKAWLCWRIFCGVVGPWVTDAKSDREPRFVINTLGMCISIYLIVQCWLLLP